MVPVQVSGTEAPRLACGERGLSLHGVQPELRGPGAPGLETGGRGKHLQSCLQPGQPHRQTDSRQGALNNHQDSGAPQVQYQCQTMKVVIVTIWQVPRVSGILRGGGQRRQEDYRESASDRETSLHLSIRNEF